MNIGTCICALKNYSGVFIVGVFWFIIPGHEADYVVISNCCIAYTELMCHYVKIFMSLFACSNII